MKKHTRDEQKNTEKLQKLISSSIDELCKLSYAMLIDNYMHLCHKSEPFKYIPEEILKDFIAYVKTNIFTLKDINAKTAIKDKIDEINNWKEKIAKLYLESQLYSAQCTLIEFIYFNQRAYAEASGDEAFYDIATRIMNECIIYFNEFEETTLDLKISNLLCTVPIKMAREKYYNQLKELLKIKCNNSPGSEFIIIEHFKRTFYPAAYPGYGKNFFEAADFITNLFNVNAKDTETNEKFGDIPEITEEKHTILKEFSNNFIKEVDILKKMYTSCNYMNVLLTYLPNWNESYENILMQSGFLRVKEENADIEKIKKLDDELNLKKLLNQFLKSQIKTKNEINSIMKNDDEVFEDEEIFNLMTNYSNLFGIYASKLDTYAYLHIENLPKEEPTLDKIEEAIDKAIDYIKEISKSISPKFAKLLRQKSLSKFNDLYTPNQTLDYIHDCLYCGDAKYLDYCNIMLYQLFSNDGFDINEYIDDDFDVEDNSERFYNHQHHHDHDCSCGHNHHD